MKADKFIKTLRTIIREEVRLAVRQEMELLLEQPSPIISETRQERISQPVPDLRSKYAASLMGDAPIKYSNKQTNRAVPVADNINEILAETAKSMRNDPDSRGFYEGL